MNNPRRFSALAFALLLGAICSPAAKASTAETPWEGPLIESEAHVTFVPSVDAATLGEYSELPDDPAIGRQQPPVDVAALSDSELPDDPAIDRQQQKQPQQQEQPQTTASTAAPEGLASPQQQIAQGKQTKRILFVVPNFRAVSADEDLPPQTVKEKLKTSLEDSVDYSSFIFVAGQAGVGMASKSYPEFGQGMKGYGRYYWHTLADCISENTFVEFVVPSMLGQDTRFYTKGHGNLGMRAGYALTRVFITRTDDGSKDFNYSEILGAGAFSALANVYYPSQERTVTKTYQRYITNLAIDGFVFVFKEVWPDLNGRFFHQVG